MKGHSQKRESIVIQVIPTEEGEALVIMFAIKIFITNSKFS
jgi:hypothetical protein